MDPFNGTDDVSAWLKRFDERFKKKTSSYKLKKFGNLVEGECRLWWDRLGDAGNEWAATREAFKAYWIDGLRGDALTVKCRDITSSSPVSVNTVTAAPTPPPVTKPEPSEAHPMFSVLVSTSIIDPRGIYAKAFAEFSRATDQEAMFQVIWDAAFEAGKQCGVLKGRGEVRAESIEEGRQLGLAIVKQAAEREKELQEARTTTSISIDTTGLTPEPEHEHEPEPDHHIPPISSEPSAEPATVLSPLNWADDADTIPATTLIPPSSSPTRDLTVLPTRYAFVSSRQISLPASYDHTD
uniref:Uncharacterized protein n=1 Tax=Moniliophthora roreri TaxID=221103 RepID=A0A0W0G340_MONRR